MALRNAVRLGLTDDDQAPTLDRLRGRTVDRARPEPDFGESTVWSGPELVVWGGDYFDGGTDRGWAFTPP